MQDAFTLTTENKFNDSPPFGLFDIFNHLIYHSCDYDKQCWHHINPTTIIASLTMVTQNLCQILLQKSGIHVCVRERFLRAVVHSAKGKGPSQGSVLDALCKCKGGRDGVCRRVAASMYFLIEFLLNSQGRDSVTSGPCLWQRKSRTFRKVHTNQSLSRESLNIRGCNTFTMILGKNEFEKKNRTKIWLCLLSENAL